MKSFGVLLVCILGSSSAKDVMSNLFSFSSIAVILSTRDLVRGRGARFLALELLVERPCLVFTMVNVLCFQSNLTYGLVVLGTAKFFAFSNGGSVEL